MNTPYVFKRCNSCGEWLVACSVNFHKNKSNKYNLDSRCKVCKKKYNKQWREENKEHIKERNKQYYQDNKKYHNEWMHQWREENKERIKERGKQYYQDNRDKLIMKKKLYNRKNKERLSEYHLSYRKTHRDKYLEYAKQYRLKNKKLLSIKNKEYRNTPQGQISEFNRSCRRRQRKNNQGDGITPEQWLEMMNCFDWKCAYSGQKLKDNRSTDHIKPLNRGGEHNIWNAVPMDRGLNSSKKDKNMEEWYREQPFFSEERLQKIYEWQEYAYNKYHKEEIV